MKCAKKYDLTITDPNHNLTTLTMTLTMNLTMTLTVKRRELHKKKHNRIPVNLKSRWRRSSVDGHDSTCSNQDLNGGYVAFR